MDITQITFVLPKDKINSHIQAGGIYDYTRRKLNKTKTLSSNIPQLYSSVSNLHQISGHAITRLSKIYRSIRPNGQGSPFSNKEYIMPFPSGISEWTHAHPIPLENQTLQVVQPRATSMGTGISSTISHNPNRCLSSRLGFSNRKSKVLWSFQQVCESTYWSSWPYSSHSLLSRQKN